MLNTERVSILRSKAISPDINYQEFHFRFYEYLEKHACLPFERRLSGAWKHAFSNTAPVIDEYELIVGKATSSLTAEENEKWLTLQKTLLPEYQTAYGQDSHMAVDFELLLKNGISGIIRKIQSLLETADAEKELFYRSCIDCLKGVVAFQHRYRDHALDLYEKEENAERKEELRKLSIVLSNVPEHPAKTLHEAVQSVHFLAFCLSYDPLRPFSMQQFQLGHPDRYLYPYYENDLKNKTITKDDAQLLMDLIAIQINNRVPSGLSSGYMVGGRDHDGKYIANDLTYMLLESIDHVKLVYPSVGLLCSEGMPEDLIRHSVRILANGRSHPAFFNDDIIQKGLIHYGTSKEDASEYIHSTCVEITPCAASNVWVASPYTNMLSLLIKRMDESYETFEGLKNAVLSDLSLSIKRNFEEQNRLRLLRKEHSYHPLLSCFVNDCLARGTDIERGGARYNWIMPSFVGMANLVDSLYALKTFVFEKKEFSLSEIKSAMDNNFEGQELLRLKLMSQSAKYGNDLDEVDGLFDEIVSFIVRECEKYTPILSGARLIPSVFCWVMHERFGRETGASPDGRLSGFPLGDGSGPCQGRERNGPTASILSSTKWDHSRLIGGVAVNMKFTKKTFSESSGEKVMTLIKTYLERGGFELQLNVVDHETLLKARENPDAYRDLVVRIGGYSDYFVKISPEMQSEVIERTSHEV